LKGETQAEGEKSQCSLPSMKAYPSYLNTVGSSIFKKRVSMFKAGVTDPRQPFAYTSVIPSKNIATTCVTWQSEFTLAVL